MLNKITVLVIITVLLFIFVMIYTVERSPVEPAVRETGNGSGPDEGTPNDGLLGTPFPEVTIPPNMDAAHE